MHDGKQTLLATHSMAIDSSGAETLVAIPARPSVSLSSLALLLVAEQNGPVVESCFGVS